MTDTEPVVGSRWRHFKGGLYEVVCMATDERNLQRGVVYRNVQVPEKVWFRPLHDFLATITHRVDGQVATQARFIQEE